MGVGTCDPKENLTLHTHTPGKPSPRLLRNSGIKSGSFSQSTTKDLPSDTPAWQPANWSRTTVGKGGCGGGEDGLLGPFNIEDEVVIAKARHPCNGTSGILPAVEADKSKTLGAGADSQAGIRTGPLLSSHPLPRPAHPPWTGQWSCPWPNICERWSQKAGRVPGGQSPACPQTGW